MLRGRPVFSHETGTSASDGSRSCSSYNAIVLHDNQGNILGATGTATDVTERRRSEGRQAAIADLGRRALEGTELAELTQYAVELVARRARRRVQRGVRAAPRGWGAQVARVGRLAGGEPRRHFPGGPNASHAAYTLEQDEPVVVEDFESERRFIRSAALAELGVSSGVCVMIEGDRTPLRRALRAQRPVAGLQRR